MTGLGAEFRLIPGYRSKTQGSGNPVETTLLYSRILCIDGLDSFILHFTNPTPFI